MKLFLQVGDETPIMVADNKEPKQTHTMKQYEKSIKVNSSVTPVKVPYIPYLYKKDPNEGDVVNFVYDEQGNYMGWATNDDAKRYILGGLYYHTNNEWKVSTTTRGEGTLKIGRNVVVARRDNSLAYGLYIWTRKVTSAMLVDDNDIRTKAKITLDNVKTAQLNVWNYHGIMDQYKLLDIPNEMEIVQKEINQVLKNYRNRLIHKLEDIISAQDHLKEESEKSGLDLNF